MKSRVRLPLGATALLACMLCGGLGTAGADEIVMRNGKVHRGYPRVQGREIQLNVYGCSVPEMTRGVRRLRAVDVRVTRPYPMADFLQRSLEEIGAADVDRRLDLMRRAQSARLKPWTLRLAAEILVRKPTNAEALKVVGGPEAWAAQRRGTPRLDPRLAREIRRMLRRESGAERRVEAARLAKRYGYDPGPDVVERMVRSSNADRGISADVPLSLYAKAFKGATYTLFVPDAYDPLVPRPLLVALHGGGIMKEKGASVRGSAKDALAHYLEGARALGWFLLCPDAYEAPWTTSKNVAVIQATIAEVTTLWNVDLERLHMAGQGGGGDGTWYYTSRKADRFASVSVASAGKPLAAGTTASKAAVWLYHGEADAVVPVEPVRKAADGLLRQKAEFVYCELPKEGHGLAPAARRDMFRYIAPKRRRRAKQAWPRSSFSVPSSKGAIAAFGDPASAWGIGLPEKADAAELLEILKAGRMDAEHAARRLHTKHAAAKDEIGAEVRKLVRDRERTATARVWAAWLCGAWVDKEAINPLGDTLRSSKETRLLRYAARAVGQIGSSDSTQDLRWALADVSKRYRAIKGRTVPYQEFERACRLGAAIAEAIGLCVTEPDEVLGEMEEFLVRHVLMDRRRVVYAAENGEDPSLPRSRLVESLAAAYKRLKADATLIEMLRVAVRRDRAALQAMMRGLRTPPR